MSRRLARRPVPLPAADLQQLRQRVRARAENRPAVYRMLDADGRIIYVGKAKRLRTRLLTYFRAEYPDDKPARILYASHDITWDYAPSEFSAYLGELRQIKQYRPHFNYRGNLTRRAVFIKVSRGPAPRVYAGEVVTRDDARCYGPFRSLGRTGEAVRTLNDLLGLRDCAATMPIVFSGQGDLFGSTRQAACLRHEFGFCSGPCAGFVAERDYRAKLETAIAFLEGRTIQPIDRVVSAMQEASKADRFELAARWREKFEHLEWLLAATSRARTAVDLLTFVYRDPGTYGDDRVYLVRQGVVRAAFPDPTTPIENEAFRGVVAAELAKPEPAPGPLPLESVDEILLLMSWFRAHPDALRHTAPLSEWV
ncbi:MAG TPA: UvrB/UvrC motif-containing protein [Gemmatimonadales bacterium]|nr:UvrB/UvrC motif-containing protein [Gemmatimonadales bacterium]